MDEKDHYYTEVDNVRLMEDNIRHLEFELNSDKLFCWRVARESHQLLLRSMVETLKGTANLLVTEPKKGKSHNKTRYYHIGNEPWKKIIKTSIEGCKIAWRYSEPIICPEDEIPSGKRGNILNDEDKQLLGFYDLLAMIQTECCMSSFVMSKPVLLSDDDMSRLEWLHLNVRNENEHFIPKFMIIGNIELLEDAVLCLSKTNELLFESGNVIPDDKIVLFEERNNNILRAIKHHLNRLRHSF